MLQTRNLVWNTATFSFGVCLGGIVGLEWSLLDRGIVPLAAIVLRAAVTAQIILAGWWFTVRNQNPTRAWGGAVGFLLLAAAGTALDTVPALVLLATLVGVVACVQCHATTPRRS